MTNSTPVKRRSNKAGPILWTPASGITYSALSLFLQCREQFRLAYVEGWSPKKVSDAIEFGSIFHNFCEHFDFEAFASSSTPDKILLSQIAKIRSAWFLARKAKHLTTDDTYNSLFETASILFKCYARIQANAHLNWLVREGQFRPIVTIPRKQSALGTSLPQETEGAGREIMLRGKRDGVFQYDQGNSSGNNTSSSSGGLWIFETKTKSQIDEDGLLSSLGSDLQSMLYAYATEQEFQRPVSGILYNVIRRPQSRQKQGESLTAFLSRLESTILKDPDHYFFRQQVTLHTGDLDRWSHRVLFPILNQLLDWWESITTPPCTPLDPWASPKHYFNPDALYNRYGRAHLFEMLTSGNVFTYKKRRSVFPELAE